MMVWPKWIEIKLKIVYKNNLLQIHKSKWIEIKLKLLYKNNLLQILSGCM